MLMLQIWYLHFLPGFSEITTAKDENVDSENNDLDDSVDPQPDIYCI